MKFTILICLLLVAAAAANYGMVGFGTPIIDERPIEMGKCPAYDDPNHIVMFAYPNDCRKYYTCLNGLAYPHQCPDNLFWSQLTYRCDFRQYSNCEINNYPDSIQYSAYPGDCSRYYETRVLQCPINTFWNEQLQRCDQPQFSNCRTFPTALPPLITPVPSVPTAATPPSMPLPVPIPTNQPAFPAPIDPEYLCKNVELNTYLPYPGDCHKFIYCGPAVQVLPCPPGLYWNPNTNACGSSINFCQFLEI